MSEIIYSDYGHLCCCQLLVKDQSSFQIFSPQMKLIGDKSVKWEKKDHLRRMLCWEITNWVAWDPRDEYFDGFPNMYVITSLWLKFPLSHPSLHMVWPEETQWKENKGKCPEQINIGDLVTHWLSHWATFNFGIWDKLLIGTYDQPLVGTRHLRSFWTILTISDNFENFYNFLTISTIFEEEKN